jgi:ubiquinone/menaquinone biosynthesis C-methylase UbiE
LKEVEIKPKASVLDFGCGPGSYSLIVSKYVGESGKVYALDIHPLAVQRVQEAALKKGLTNIETICSDCATGLPDDGLDVILLYDVFHMFSNPNKILEELYRVLKQDGSLSFSDHHMEENDIISRMTNNGLFRLSKKGERTYSFVKE